MSISRVRRNGQPFSRPSSVTSPSAKKPTTPARTGHRRHADRPAEPRAAGRTRAHPSMPARPARRWRRCSSTSTASRKSTTPSATSRRCAAGRSGGAHAPGGPAGDVIARLGGDEFVIAGGLHQGRERGRAHRREVLDVLTAPIKSPATTYHRRPDRHQPVPRPTADQGECSRPPTPPCTAPRTPAATATVLRPEMTAPRASDRSRRLRPALARGEFVLHYQPRIDLRRIAMVGVEALIRWNHPERGLVLAGAIHPHRRRDRRHRAHGRWVLHVACMQTRREAESSANCVSVNVSARQLASRPSSTRSPALAETGSRGAWSWNSPKACSSPTSSDRPSCRNCKPRA